MVPPTTRGRTLRDGGALGAPLAEPRISEQSRAEKRQRWLTSIDLGVQFVTCLSNTDVLPHGSETRA